jgi:hypothetical protein
MEAMEDEKVIVWFECAFRKKKCFQ